MNDGNRIDDKEDDGEKALMEKKWATVINNFERVCLAHTEKLSNSKM